jgi:hypothetical protein
MVKISPEWITGPEVVKSSGRIGTFSLWTGTFRDDICGTYSKGLESYHMTLFQLISSYRPRTVPSLSTPL